MLKKTTYSLGGVKKKKRGKEKSFYLHMHKLEAHKK
jgi:hypothetical protein